MRHGKSGIGPLEDGKGDRRALSRSSAFPGRNATRRATRIEGLYKTRGKPPFFNPIPLISTQFHRRNDALSWCASAGRVGIGQARPPVGIRVFRLRLSALCWAGQVPRRWRAQPPGGPCPWPLARPHDASCAPTRPRTVPWEGFPGNIGLPRHPIKGEGGARETT